MVRKLAPPAKLAKRSEAVFNKVMIHVALVKISLDDYGNGDLRRKERELEKLIRWARSKIHLILIESESFNDPEKSVLAFTTLGLERPELIEKIHKLVARIDEVAFARIVDTTRTIRVLEEE